MIEKTFLSRFYIDFTKPYTDYIPVVSTMTNGADLFWHCIGRNFYSKEEQSKNYYLVSLEIQPLSHYCIALIPVIGNLFLFVLRVCEVETKVSEWEYEINRTEATDKSPVKFFKKGQLTLVQPEQKGLVIEKLSCFIEIFKKLAWIPSKQEP